LWLKRLAAIFSLTLVCVSLGWPWIVGPKPEKGASKKAYLQFASKSATCLGIIIISIAGAGICSLLIIKQEKERYREEAMNNLKEMLSNLPKPEPKPEAKPGPTTQTEEETKPDA
jgi:hypothetical protein